MSVQIAKELHTGRTHVLEPDGTVRKDISHQARSALKIDATAIADHASDMPQYWSNYKRWQPFKLIPGNTFWVEYSPTPPMLTDRSEWKHLSSLASLVTVDTSEDSITLTVKILVREKTTHLLPTTTILHVDNDGKVSNVNMFPEPGSYEEKAQIRREVFFACLPLFVLSNLESNDVDFIPKTAKPFVRNSNSKDKRKRKAAQEQAKMKYWELQIIEPAQEDDSMDTTADEKERT